MLQVERVELLANAFQHNPSLQSLFVTGPLILSNTALLLLRLLRADNSLLSERRLEALELRAGHGECDANYNLRYDRVSKIFSNGNSVIVISKLLWGGFYKQETLPPLERI
jgi:hypothetical protein